MSEKRPIIARSTFTKMNSAKIDIILINYPVENLWWKKITMHIRQKSIGKKSKNRKKLAFLVFSIKFFAISVHKFTYSLNLFVVFASELNMLLGLNK